MLEEEREAEISLLDFQRMEEVAERTKKTTARTEKREPKAILATLNAFCRDQDAFPNRWECLSTAAFALKSLHYSLL